jgi:hypothetical protein
MLFRLNWQPLYVGLSQARFVFCVRPGGGMAKDGGTPPLPRRVPGAGNSPRPPARVNPPVLPESVRQRLLSVIASESAATATEQSAPADQASPPDPAVPPDQAAPPEQAAPADQAASSDQASPAEQAASSDLTTAARASSEQAVPQQRQALATSNGTTSSGNGLPGKAGPQGAARSLPRLAVHTEAPTEPFPRLAGAAGGDTAGPALTKPEAQPGSAQPPRRRSPPGRLDQPDLVVQPRRLAPPDPVVETRGASEATAAPVREGRAAGQQGRRRPASSGRRYKIIGALIAVMALIGVGSLILLHHAGLTPKDGPVIGQNGQAEAKTRNLAAAWVASQVSRAVIVSCDPEMCQALESHGVPASDITELGPDTTSPLHSDVIVATPLVRAQFGNLLGTVYAPAVIASFGSGQLRIDIRLIAPHGAGAYRSALHADLLDRKTTGAALLHVNQIAASATARRQLLAGQADARLLIAIADMADAHPVYLVGFGGSSPGADPALPLRSAEVTEVGHGRVASRSVSRAFVRSMVKILSKQPAPYAPAHAATVRTSGGHLVLRIEFTAPSPLNLLGGSHQP